MFKLARKKSTAGFTLIEIMAAILILTFFLTVTMQAMVIAAMFKVKAKRYTQATAWIQQDIEKIRNTASQLAMNGTVSAFNATAKTLNPSNISTLAVNDKIIIGTSNKTYTITAVSTSSVTVDSPFSTDVAVGNKVVETTLCTATASTAGLGDHLQDNLPAVSPTTQPIAGQTYQITRTATPKNVMPYNILEISYTVTPQNQTTPVIAENFSEVIPDASLYCPQ